MTDLISRKQAIEALHREIVDNTTGSEGPWAKSFYKKARKAIVALPSSQPAPKEGG